MSPENDNGVPIRTAMHALTSFGVPEEKRFRSFDSTFDREPPPHLYTYANNFKAKESDRLDKGATFGRRLLYTIKDHLSREVPLAFGFATCDNCISQSDVSHGLIPFPATHRGYTRYHSVMAVGYDDSMKIANTESEGETSGALIIRNSWGQDWGDKGYGYLPYEYIINGLTQDWWILLDLDWVDIRKFE